MNCDKNCNCQVFHQDTLDSVSVKMYQEKEYKKMVDLYKILNDLTRIKILDSIKDHELCVCDLAYLIGVSKSAISHQMKYLKSYQLVKSKKIKKMVYYSLLNQEIRKLIELGYHMVEEV
jgi:ArsR family transcriptional regulator, lead/cadmium/zinc/bismuth-responsive transcriptional repressor